MLKSPLSYLRSRVRVPGQEESSGEAIVGGSSNCCRPRPICFRLFTQDSTRRALLGPPARPSATGGTINTAMIAITTKFDQGEAGALAAGDRAQSHRAQA